MWQFLACVPLSDVTAPWTKTSVFASEGSRTQTGGRIGNVSQPAIARQKELVICHHSVWVINGGP